MATSFLKNKVLSNAFRSLNFFTVLFILIATAASNADNQIIPGNTGISKPAPIVEGDTMLTG